MATHSTTIDDVEYETTTHPADKALDLLAEVAAILPEDELAQAVAIGAAVAGKIADEPDLTNAQVAAAVLSAIDPRIIANAVIRGARNRGAVDGGISGLAKRLLARTTSPQCFSGVAPKHGNVGKFFGPHFTGRLRHLAKVLQWVFEVGFEEL